MYIQARYDDYDQFRNGLQGLKDAHMPRYEAYGPTNLLEIEELMPERSSLVRGWATSGALIGLSTFWIMCVTTALIYSIITGGKPPVSNVPFVIPMYEGTILVGSILGFLAGLYYARLGPRFPPLGFSPRFTEDSYGIVVQCSPRQKNSVLNILRQSGASEIHESG